jgi:hypothetical protein
MRVLLPIFLSAIVSLPAESSVATEHSPTSVAEILKNIKKVGNECTLLDDRTFSSAAMLQLFGARDATFWNREGERAGPGDYLTSVQVRASDFAEIAPKLSTGPTLQLVGQSGRHSAYLRFLLSDLSGVNLRIKDAEGALETKLSYVRLPTPMPFFEGTPGDPSYYLLEHADTRCHYRLQIHFWNDHLDEIYFKEEPR